MPNRYGNRSRDRTNTTQHRASRQRVLDRDNRQCQIRGPHCTGTATVKDHIIPDAEGGDDSDANGQAACWTCNHEKSLTEAARGTARRHARLRLPPERHPGLL